MKITDLRFESDCLPTLAEWHHREWAHLNPGGSVEKRIEKMQSYLGDELIPSLFVAKDADTLLGSAGLLSHDMDTRMDLSPWLASVYVAPEHRGRGVGTALVKHVMNVAKAAGCEDLYLFTPDRAGFYARLGWFTLAEELYRGEPVTVMRASLRG